MSAMQGMIGGIPCSAIKCPEGYLFFLCGVRRRNGDSKVLHAIDL
jgi:hypothetical protein